MQKKAHVNNYHYSSQGHQQTSQVPQVRSRKESHLRRRADRTGDPILANAVFDATHVILRLKLGDHEGLALFVHGRLLKRTLLIVPPVIPNRVSLSPVPVYC